MLPLFDCESDGEFDKVTLGVNVGGGVLLSVALELTVEEALGDCEMLPDAVGDALAVRDADVVAELL